MNEDVSISPTKNRTKMCESSNVSLVFRGIIAYLRGRCHKTQAIRNSLRLQVPHVCRAQTGHSGYSKTWVTGQIVFLKMNFLYFPI